jgi:hypothetical protein
VLGKDEMFILHKIFSISYSRGILIFLLVVLLGCTKIGRGGLGREGSVGRLPPEFEQIIKNVHVIRPYQTDPNINTFPSPHIAYRNPRVPRKNKLFVFLPGTEAKPSGVKHLLKVVADTGIPVIGLSYPNEPSVRSLCQNDPDCYGRVRHEIVYGVNTSPLVNVDPANSIVGRLTRLLQYLSYQFPEEGWGEFLVNGHQINWSKIILAGHSQGGGHAAYIAKDNMVSRVITFASPFDTISQPGDPRIRPANWLLRPHVTPSNRYYGFGHINDFTLDVLVPIWRVQQYPGEPVNVDRSNSWYNYSHQLYTTRPPRTGNTYHDAHMSIVLDRATPMDRNGYPIFAPVWRYLCCSG